MYIHARFTFFIHRETSLLVFELYPLFMVALMIDIVKTAWIYDQFTVGFVNRKCSASVTLFLSENSSPIINNKQYN